ncbi:hypothetical protein DW680_20770, partial [Parabacteroides distasonis]
VSARLTNHYHRILREEDFVTAEKLRNAFLGVGVMENCILKDFGNMNREFEAMVEKGQRAKSKSPPGSPTTTTAFSGKRISSPPKSCATPSSVSA